MFDIETNPSCAPVQNHSILHPLQKSHCAFADNFFEPAILNSATVILLLGRATAFAGLGNLGRP